MEGYEMVAYLVGECYPEFKQNYGEGLMFDMINPMHHGIFVLAMRDPKASVVKSFEEAADIQLSLLEEKGMPFLILKIGKLGWFDCIYNPYGTIAAGRMTREEIENLSEEPFGISVLLTDAPKGKVLAISQITTSQECGAQLVKMAKNGLKMGLQPDMNALQAIYRKYPTAESMAKAGTVYSI